MTKSSARCAEPMCVTSAASSACSPCLPEPGSCRQARACSRSLENASSMSVEARPALTLLPARHVGEPDDGPQQLLVPLCGERRVVGPGQPAEHVVDVRKHVVAPRDQVIPGGQGLPGVGQPLAPREQDRVEVGQLVVALRRVELHQHLGALLQLLELLKHLQQRRVRRQRRRRQRAPLGEGVLDALVAPGFGLAQLAVVDGGVAQPVPVGRLPSALHQQGGLRAGPGLGVLGQELPLVERLGRRHDALLPQSQLGLRRVDQHNLARLPPVHALGVRVLRGLPRAVPAERERPARLVVQGALLTHGRTGVGVAQRRVHVGQRIVPLRLGRVQGHAGLKQRHGHVPGAEARGQVAQQRGGQLGGGRAGAQGGQPALHRVWRRVRRLEVRQLLVGAELPPRLREERHPHVVGQAAGGGVVDQLGQRRQQLPQAEPAGAVGQEGRDVGHHRGRRAAHPRARVGAGGAGPLDGEGGEGQRGPGDCDGHVGLGGREQHLHRRPEPQRPRARRSVRIVPGHDVRHPVRHAAADCGRQVGREGAAGGGGAGAEAEQQRCLHPHRTGRQQQLAAGERLGGQDAVGHREQKRVQLGRALRLDRRQLEHHRRALLWEQRGRGAGGGHHPRPDCPEQQQQQLGVGRSLDQPLEREQEGLAGIAVLGQLAGAQADGQLERGEEQLVGRGRGTGGHRRGLAPRQVLLGQSRQHLGEQRVVLGDERRSGLADGRQQPQRAVRPDHVDFPRGLRIARTQPCAARLTQPLEERGQLRLHDRRPAGGEHGQRPQRVVQEALQRLDHLWQLQVLLKRGREQRMRLLQVAQEECGLPLGDCVQHRQAREHRSRAVHRRRGTAAARGRCGRERFVQEGVLDRRVGPDGQGRAQQ
eukprot:scaffold19613_cov101-Isochrysis_galbana.AAC.2